MMDALARPPTVERLAAPVPLAVFALALAPLVLSGAAARAEGAPAAPACTVERDPAADLVRDFRAAVLAYLRTPAGSAVKSRDRQLSFLAGEAERSLLPHRDVLRRHVVWALGRLPREPLPDMSKWEHLPLGAVIPKMTAELQAEASPRGMKLALFWDPTRSIWFVRGAVSDVANGGAWLQRDGVLERFVPPRIVWANGDVDAPVVAFVKRRDVFAVTFAYDAASESYVPREITWARRPTPGAPAAPVGSMPAAGVLQELANAVEAYDPKDADDAGTSFADGARAFAIQQGDRLSASHADELRAYARCVLLKLPRRELPDTRSWRVVSTGAPSAPAPRQLAQLPLNRWEPRRLFGVLLSQTMAAHEGVPPSRGRRGELDMVAPPVLVRVNDDLDAPVLAIVDPDEVFTVALRYDPALPGYVADGVKRLQRPAAP
jgi:hypothetical protein